MRGDGITVKSIAVASRRPRPTGVGGSPPPAIAPGNQTFRRKTWPEAAPVLVYRKFSIPKLDDVNPKLDEFRQQDGAAPGRVRPGRQVLPQRRFRFPSSPPHATKNGGPHRHLPTKSRRWARGDRFASLPYLHEGMYGTQLSQVRPYLARSRDHRHQVKVRAGEFRLARDKVFPAKAEIAPPLYCALTSSRPYISCERPREESCRP